MDKFAKAFVDTKLQPQIFSMVVIVLILTVFAIIIYSKVKKQKMNKAPEGLLAATEMYVMGVDTLFKTATDGKFHKPAPYIFTLITFLIVGNLLGLLGLETPASSYSTTLTLGLVSWIGIYVTGLIYQKFRFFKKFLNPVELIGQFSPLISISFRIFGNMIGGSTIMYLLYTVTGSIWAKIPVIGELNLLGSAIAPAFHVYFDIFDGLVQAFVFTLLTMIYWTLEAEESEVEQKIDEKLKERKAINIAIAKKRKLSNAKA